MDQSEIDALMNPGAGKSSKKSKAASSDAKSASSVPEEKPADAVTPVVEQAAAPVAASAVEQMAAQIAAQTVSKPAESKSEPKADAPQARLITEIGSVTSVTERETNKVMDKLDEISQLLDRQKDIITQMMGRDEAQNHTIQEAIHQIMTAGSDIQNKIYEAMDLMQFQDITRQKLERIIHHLRQIHDYIIELLGTGFKQEQPKVSVSRTIAQTGTTPDENKGHADSVIAEFQRAK